MGIEKKYKLYVFDLDGTLVDTSKDIAIALQKVIVSAGRQEASQKKLLSSIGGGAKKAINMLTGLEGEKLDLHLELFMNEYEQICSDNTIVYEGGEELLKKLKEQGALLAVVTMKARKPTVKILKAHKLDMFDEVISFDDVQKRKPDPDSMNKLLEKYNLKPHEALMVGDMVTDIKYAKAAGVDACAMEYGFGITKEVLSENPKYTLSSLLNF